MSHGQSWLGQPLPVKKKHILIGIPGGTWAQAVKGQLCIHWFLLPDTVGTKDRPDWVKSAEQAM